MPQPFQLGTQGSQPHIYSTFRFVSQTAEYMTLVIPQPARPGHPLSSDQPLPNFMFSVAFCDANKNILIIYQEAEVPSTKNFPWPSSHLASNNEDLLHNLTDNSCWPRYSPCFEPISPFLFSLPDDCSCLIHAIQIDLYP